MKYLMLAISIVLYTGLFAVVNGKDAAGLPAIVLKEESNPSSRYGGDDLSDSERAGGGSLVQGHGGNERFFTYIYQQRAKQTDAFKGSGQTNEDCWVGNQRMTAMAKS